MFMISRFDENISRSTVANVHEVQCREVSLYSIARLLRGGATVDCSLVK